MSQNMQLNPPRVPIGTVDPATGQVLITAEWYRWMRDMFDRVGGVEGFSNQELYGDAALQQSHDELLQRVGAQEAMNRGQYADALLEDVMNRIAALEAASRGLAQAVQMMVMTMPMDAPTQSAIENVLDKLTVKGNTRLATERGTVLVGMVNSGTSEQFQVAKDMRVQESVRLAGNTGRVVIGSAADDGSNKLQVDGAARVQNGAHLAAASGRVLIGPGADDGSNRLQVNGAVKASSYRVGNNQVVGARQSGVSAYSEYSGQTVSATYDQSEAQTTDDAIRTASQKLAQVVTALRAHGLIGD